MFHLRLFCEEIYLKIKKNHIRKFLKNIREQNDRIIELNKKGALK